jgi:hypothetical protein
MKKNMRNEKRTVRGKQRKNPPATLAIIGNLVFFVGTPMMTGSNTWVVKRS